MNKSDLIIPKPNPPPRKHFSLSDWVVTPEVGWMIDDQFYVSAPTAVTIWKPNTSQTRRIFLGEALGKCIPQGRLSTYHLFQWTGWNEFFLNWRCQSYSDEQWLNNAYSCRFWQNGYDIRKKIAGVLTPFASGALPYTREEDEWNRFQITWWLVLNEEFSWSLRMLLEQEHLGEWVEVVNTVDDDPSFSDSEVNYAGIRIHSYGLYYYTTYLDDTMVWRKSE